MFFSALDDSASQQKQQYQTSKVHHNNHLSNPSSDSKNATKKSPLNIHIEVDIDPPEQPLSPQELLSLGLPATHVHYDVNKQLTSSADHHEELLAPSDIKVTYSEEEEPLRDKLLTSVASEEVLAYQNYARYNR